MSPGWLPDTHSQFIQPTSQTAPSSAQRPWRPSDSRAAICTWPKKRPDQPGRLACWLACWLLAAGCLLARWPAGALAAARVGQVWQEFGRAAERPAGTKLRPRRFVGCRLCEPRWRIRAARFVPQSGAALAAALATAASKWTLDTTGPLAGRSPSHANTMGQRARPASRSVVWPDGGDAGRHQRTRLTSKRTQLAGRQVNIVARPPSSATSTAARWWPSAGTQDDASGRRARVALRCGPGGRLATVRRAWPGCCFHLFAHLTGQSAGRPGPRRQLAETHRRRRPSSSPAAANVARGFAGRNDIIRTILFLSPRARLGAAREPTGWRRCPAGWLNVFSGLECALRAWGAHKLELESI